MRDKYLQFLKKYGLLDKYSDEEINKAYEILMIFLTKLESMKVTYDGKERQLSQIEEFILIYDFVSNRIYKENEDNRSHDIVGALIEGEAVCQGFTQLMEFICDIKKIPFLYKHVDALDENENWIGPHGNFQVIIRDDNNFEHCLHCDPTIDCPKSEDDILGYNAMLIATDEINNYYHTQVPSGSDVATALLWDIGIKNFVVKDIKEKNEQPNIIDLFCGMSESESINKKYLQLNDSIKKINEFLNANLILPQSNNDILTNYQILCERYEKTNVPFDRNQLYSKIQWLYSNLFHSKEVDQIIQSRLETTDKRQQDFWKLSSKTLN